MSIWSDHDCGALSDEDFERECIRMNNKDRWEAEQMLNTPMELQNEIRDARMLELIRAQEDSEGGLIEDE